MIVESKAYYLCFCYRGWDRLARSQYDLFHISEERCRRPGGERRRIFHARTAEPELGAKRTNAASRTVRDLVQSLSPPHPASVTLHAEYETEVISNGENLCGRKNGKGRK